MRTFFIAAILTVVVAGSAHAGDLHGTITDKTGGVLPGALVQLLNIANGDTTSVLADRGGSYRFPSLAPGLYRVAASLAGFSDASKTIVLTDADPAATLNFVLQVGTLRAETTAIAARGARDTQVVPLRADTLSGDLLRALVPVSTGDALVGAPGVTPVGSGPFQVRPRLRGLDSTRVLVLVDGERLNNSRTATDRAGIEVGLVDTDSIESIEVVGGAGSVLYGTDALAGTINIITNRARLSAKPVFVAGLDALYSSNENGRRGTVSVGYSAPRFAVAFTGGAERFDDYHSGRPFDESSQPFLTDGRLVQADTIDTNFGFNFRAFPEAFNAPFTRTSDVIQASGMNGSTAEISAAALVTASQHLQVKYQRRHASDIGFPDFVQPYFFQSIALPWSNLDKISGQYTFTNLSRALPKLTISAYHQLQDRLLRNVLPVQFPVPSPAFFPIAVDRLDIQSDTQQRVWTNGLDVQANVLVRPDNVLTAGVTAFHDRSEDTRATATQMTQIGSVDLGTFGPTATVFATPVPIGPLAIDHPVRVPNATFRDVGLFAQDEWDATPVVRVTAGLRLDTYRVGTEATPGYDVASLVEGAMPAIDPATLPNVSGEEIRRHAFTGEVGVVVWSQRRLSLFSHYVRSYRHPNLEELLFSGPATAGNIVPNVQVAPETGHNVDAGARVRTSGMSGSIAYFNNTYRGFISTEEVADSPQGSISQAINLARVRIQGVEGQADAPFVAGGLLWAPMATLAWTRGTVLSGTSPLSGVSLAGEPQDNITPLKGTLGLRVGDRHDRWWVAYGVRAERAVTRVSPLLSDSPFLIAQDLLGLDGFAVQRVAGGYFWRRGEGRLGVTLAVDNLTNTFYREQFQFAPARGRSISLAVSVK